MKLSQINKPSDVSNSDLPAGQLALLEQMRAFSRSCALLNILYRSYLTLMTFLNGFSFISIIYLNANFETMTGGFFCMISISPRFPMLRTIETPEVTNVVSKFWTSELPFYFYLSFLCKFVYQFSSCCCNCVFSRSGRVGPR